MTNSRAVSPDEVNDPFNVTKTTIRCPYHDGENLAIEVGWVNHDYPMIHISAPEVLKHLQEFHGHA